MNRLHVRTETRNMLLYMQFGNQQLTTSLLHQKMKRINVYSENVQL